MSQDHHERIIEMFSVGRWDEVLFDTSDIDLKDVIAEVHAARGIGMTFSGTPTELGTDLEDLDFLEGPRAELLLGQPCLWPEVEACLAWINLIERTSLQETEVPDDLVRLKYYAQRSKWGQIHALACRALVYYNRRQEAYDLIYRLISDRKQGSVVQNLLLEELKLETGQLQHGVFSGDSPDIGRIAVEIGDLKIDADELQPFSIETVRSWKELLDLEAISEINNAAIVLKRLEAIIASAKLSDDECEGCDSNEKRRLAARASVAAARVCLQICDVNQARYWLKHESARKGIPKWELGYLESLAFWSEGKKKSVIDSLEKAQVYNPFQTRIKVEHGARLVTDDPSKALDLFKTDTRSLDAACCRASVLSRLGRRAEAYSEIESIRKKIKWPSFRLISSASLAERVRRGWWLGANLAADENKWTEAISCMEHAHSVASSQSDESYQWWLIMTLAALQREPADVSTAMEYLEKAYNAGIDKNIHDVLIGLCGYLDGNQEAGRNISNALDAVSDEVMPKTVRAALALLSSSEKKVESFQEFVEEAGEDWLKYCPISTEEAVRLTARQAVKHGMNGKFDEADKYVEKARKLLAQSDYSIRGTQIEKRHA